tara:strand:+ start:1223 stop:1579 length:357 start_codon:yes stop_codon:yes gene_type:complete
MKLIIAGSRDIFDFNLLVEAFEESPFEIKDITEIVSGKCAGVDKLGEEFAELNHIHIEPFPADWDKYKLAAGPIRNEQMAKYADALLAIKKKGAKNRGTNSMINLAKQYGLKIYIVEA